MAEPAAVMVVDLAVVVATSASSQSFLTVLPRLNVRGGLFLSKLDKKQI